MSDQAAKLRDLLSQSKEDLVKKTSDMKIITVASGKGGVGKSNFTANLALWLKSYGKEVLILDADFGLSNIEILLGDRAFYNLSHLLSKEVGIEKVITKSQYDISFISGGSGVKEMLFLSGEQLTYIANELEKLSEITDILLIDTGAGINETVLKFSAMADEVYIIITPEPTSITDGYALIKTLIKDFELRPTIRVIINKAYSKEEATGVFQKIRYAVSEFLKVDIEYGGFIPYDETLLHAVRSQKPLVVYDKKCKASIAYREIAKILIPKEQKVDDTNWIDRFKKIFKNKY